MKARSQAMKDSRPAPAACCFATCWAVLVRLKSLDRAAGVKDEGAISWPKPGGRLMSIAMRADAVQDARSVAAAANAVVYAIRRDQAGLGDAVDRLELLAVRTVGQPVQGFDATGAEAEDEDLVTAALTQLGIGNTLLSAQAAIESAPQARGLESAVATLERTADAL